MPSFPAPRWSRGAATMLVVATGPATKLGGVAAALAARRPATAFERGLRGLGLLILRLTVFLVLFVLLAHLAFHRPPLESFLFAVALAVGLTPELLPMVTTVTLSRGAMRMAAKQVVVKRLAAIHDLGAMDVLCTDKTGTLTEARIALADATSPRVLQMAAINAGLCQRHPRPRWMRRSWRRSRCRRAGGCWPRCPSASSGGGLPCWWKARGQRLLVVKGAPEAVLEACTTADGLPFDRAALLATADARGAEGLRLLGVATRAVPEGEAVDRPGRGARPHFLGFCAFLDPPKRSAAAAVARLAELGIRTKIVSGDAAPVVRHLVAALGIPAEGLLTGEEIAGMDHHALAARVEHVDLYARVSPDQKRRILLALKARGHTVGFIGDGINDAPAIHAADAGISVAGGHRGGARRGRPDPAGARSRRAGGGRGGGPPHLCQRHEIRPHGDVLEFRQHAVDGGGVPGDPVPAAAAGADPAEQPAVRPVGDRHPLRCGGPRRTWRRRMPGTCGRCCTSPW